MQYCEQTLAILGFEPLNAWSNFGFILAAVVAAWVARRRGGAVNLRCALLILLAATIGAGSFAWHATHHAWAELADVLPILAFVLTFLWHATRSILGHSRRAGGLTCGVMALAIVGLGAQWPHALNGSLAYVPVLIAMIGFAVVMPTQVLRRNLWLAALVFTAALICRTADLALCASIPHGTHWAWHLLNSGVIFLALKVAIEGDAATRT